MITVFTPIYNRDYVIRQLYDSLCKQTDKDFEWLIIDDGSTDQTESIIKSFVLENKIVIRFFKKENGGKHRAINYGVKLAKGELFFIVDSDDRLSIDAVSIIKEYYAQIKNDDTFAGVCGLRCHNDGRKIGGEYKFNVLDCNALDFRIKYKIKGDMAEVFRTHILRNYPFPEFANEKFCPESLVWNRIAQKYKLRYFYEKIYICEYLRDGLTSKITKLRMESPSASLLYYSELGNYKISVYYKIRAAINFWRFAPYSKISFINKIMQIGLSKTCLSLPFGIILFIIDKFKNRKE